MTEEHLAVLRRHMVELVAIHADLAREELGKAALDARVTAAMGRVPRHLFVPGPLAALAYHDAPLPIGFGKTISQPFVAAVMTDLLDPRPHEAVLEVGTGLGYQAAVLAGLARRVWTVEVVEEFAAAAEARFRRLGYANVGVRVGDGSRGWAERAPVRQDHRHRGGPGGAAGAARAAQAGRPDGAAGGRRRGAAARGGGQGRGRPGRAAGADGRALRPARDRVRRTGRAPAMPPGHAERGPRSLASRKRAR
jgi:protein-L-isoaspartate(D-aspartate) O-methyltransferase